MRTRFSRAGTSVPSPPPATLDRADRAPAARARRARAQVRAAVLAAIALALAAPAARASEACIVGEVLTHGQQEKWMRKLADGIGSRLTGSEGGRRAEEAMEAEMKALGLEGVRREPFRVAASWERGPASAEVLAPVSRPLRIASYLWARGTAGAIQGDLVDLGAGSGDEVAAHRSRLKGAVGIVSLPSATITDLIASFYRMRPLAEEAQASGAAALLFVSDKDQGLLYTAPVLFDEGITDLPTASIARDDATLLRRLAAEGKPVRLRLAIENRIGPAFESTNVIGEIRGRTQPEEIVVLGAHLDSVDLGPGALDNAAGVAAVLESARAILAQGLKPRRTIRFVLFMGEEEGLLGSRAYVRQHLGEMPRTVAALIMDIGAGRPQGWLSMGRTDLDARVQATMAPLASLGVVVLEHLAFAATDNAPFMAVGVPNLLMLQDDHAYLPVHHTVADVPERADPGDLAASAAVLAATAWSIADAPERLGVKLSAAEVRKMAAETKVDVQWKAIGLWPLVEAVP